MFGKNREKKTILIIGGFHKAASLANSLLAKGYCVTVINKSYEDCEKLAEINKLKVIYGDGSQASILEDADVRNCQVVIALTDSDETNLVACELCKRNYHVKKTVAMLKDPTKTNFFYQMGVDSVVCALNMITNLMEQQAIMDEMTRMIPIDEGRIQIMEVPILKGSAITGKKLWELNFPKEIIVGCILRGEQSLIPRGDTRIIDGDILLIITSDKSKLEEVKELTGHVVSR